jgi:hypothetical protein
VKSEKPLPLVEGVGGGIPPSLPYKGRNTDFRSLHIAVMGCIVNGIGEAKNADIGIFIP